MKQAVEIRSLGLCENGNVTVAFLGYSQRNSSLENDKYNK